MFLFFGLLQGGGVRVNKLYQIITTKRLGKKRFAARTAWSTALVVITVLTLVISNSPAPDIVYKTF
jgi:predicted anti-sigma-YlaC factor YlaD